MYVMENKNYYFQNNNMKINDKVDITLIDLLKGHKLKLIIEDIDDFNNDKSIFTSFKGIKFDSKDLHGFIDKYIFNGTKAYISYGFENTIDYLKINRDTVTTKGKKELEVVFRDMIKTALIFYINEFSLEETSHLFKTHYCVPLVLYAYTTFYGLTDILYKDSNELIYCINNTIRNTNKNYIFLYTKDKEFIKVKEILKPTKDKVYINFDYLTKNNTKFIYPIKDFNRSTHKDEILYSIIFTNECDYVKIKTSKVENFEFFHKIIGHKSNVNITELERPIGIPALDKYSSLCVPFKEENTIFDKYKISYFQSIFNNFKQGGFIPILFTDAYSITTTQLYEYIDEYTDLLSNVENAENFDVDEIKKDVIELYKNMLRSDKKYLTNLTKKDAKYKNSLEVCELNKKLLI